MTTQDLEKLIAETSQSEHQEVGSLLSTFKQHLPDPDETETREWIDSLDDVVRNSGRERADFLLRKVLKVLLHADCTPTTSAITVNETPMLRL